MLPNDAALPNDWPSLDMAFDLTHERIEAQLESNDVLDNKANFVLVSSTGLLGTAAAFQAVILYSRVIPPGEYFLRNIPLTFTYLICLICAFLAYRVRNYKMVPNPHAFDLKTPARETKLALFETAKLCFDENELLLKHKKILIDAALMALCVEAVTLVLTLGFDTYR